MKLEHIIKYFRYPSALVSLYQEQGLNPQADGITIFMKDKVAPDSNIILLSEEQTNGNNTCLVAGDRYVELLPAFMVSALVNNLAGSVPDDEIALRIVDYAVNEA